LGDPAVTERELFIAALQIADDTQRQAYLKRACGDDADLRRRVGALLAAFNQAGSFLQPPAPEPSQTFDPPSERPGMQVGPYKLIQQIGEGGMGTVWMAQQSEPVKRTVAVKLIKAGLDSHQVIARFEAERQALALMDHANIARVLDAGTTPAGRPYFVMDLVRGVPITRYCDEHHLTPRQRLELFIPVCHAVQHAHQKGIIHRDLKPTNVLVALYDGQPIPKVIDFGVAKAAGQSLTDKTLVTGFGTIVGTLEYMSPEQAEADQLDIDTRSDIYSLGVLLYELLTGSPPFSRKELEKAGMLEMLRMIREQEPSKPSTKLSTAEGLPTLAANRGTEPARLTKMVRGELDWIVMKALEKDRNRRYETASGFALDVQRYLADEHVLACPPSAGYRLRKFVRRNKGALATTAIVAAALVLGSVVSVWQAVRATNALQAEKKARSDAEIARDGEKKQTSLAQNNAAERERQRQRAEANFGKARKAVEEYLTKITENELLRVPGLQPLREDLLKAALKFYAEFTQERAGDPTLRQELASAHLLLAKIQRELGNAKASQAANRESIRLYEQLRDEQRAAGSNVEVQAGLADAYFLAGRYDDTITLCQAVIQVEPKHAGVRSLLSDTQNQLANDRDNKDIAAALARHRMAFDLREGLVRDFPDDPRYLAQLSGTVNNLGNLLNRQDRYEEALAMFERAAGYATRAYELAPHSILWSRWLCIQVRNAGIAQAKLGRQEDALASYERVVSVSRKRVFENPAIGELRADLYRAYLGLGSYQREVGDTAGSSRNFRLAREVLEQIPRETPEQLFDLATVYAALSASSADAPEPPGSDTAERQQNADLSVATLKKAFDAGYQNLRELQSNQDLDPLRIRPDFQEILAAAQRIAEASQRLAQANSANTAARLANSKQAAELLQGLAAGQSRHRTTLAATLHSIGMIQTGLKQFAEAEQSLSQALQLRRELLRESASTPQPRVDVLATRAAIGQLYWESDRPEEAHRLWQEILAECRQAAAEQPQDAALHAGLAGVVWSIAQKYGEAGLWELVLPPLEQGLQSQQLVDAAWDCRGAHVLAALGRLEEHRKFCQLLAARWGKNSPPHVVWAATMNPQPAVETKRLLELADTVKASTDPMANFQAATAYYHAGE
jgi:eukaryotic-like serine/threonine-protein kinase